MQKLFALVLSITMLFTVAIVAYAAPAPVPGYPQWDAKYKEAKIVPPASGPDSELPDNPRNNASGDKIPSNAHSADFPGLYFYWDDKQKDNGVLLVAPEVFSLFEGCKFVLTAKNSDHYWGYEIKKDAGQLIDGVYAYGINKQVKYTLIGNKGEITAKTDDLKNINMVFIDGNYKKGYIKIKKTWLDWQGNVYPEKPTDVAEASFGSNYPTTGVYPIEINTWGEANNGVKVTITEDQIPGFDTSVNGEPGNSVTLTIKPNTVAKAFFANQEQPAKVIIEKKWFIGHEEVEGGEVSFTNGYKRGVNTVAPGTNVAFTESRTAGWDLIDVSVDGEGIDLKKGIGFKAERGKTYKILFTNWKPLR